MKKTSLVLLLLLSSNSIAVAKDYQIHGNTYQITEKDFLQEIQEKLQVAEKNGKIAKIQQEIGKQMENSVNSPKPVNGLVSATVNREWFYDPSVSKPHNLTDQNGRIFYRAHTKVNPLNYLSLTKTLIFINGDNETQLKWAINQNKLLRSRAKIILTNGKIMDLMRSKQIRLYFDQGGVLTSKFGIKSLPATVEQVGKLLKVREVML